jgi:hypothetical protein
MWFDIGRRDDYEQAVGAWEVDEAEDDDALLARKSAATLIG